MASWAEGLPQYEEESAEQDEETLNDLSLSSSSVDNFELQNSAQELSSSSSPTSASSSAPSSASASTDDLKTFTAAEEEVTKFLQKASSSFSSLSVEKIQEETIKVLKAKAIEQRIEILTLKQKVHELQCQLQSARVALQTGSPATSSSSSPNLNSWSATQTPSEGSSKKARRRSVNSTHDATINSHRKSEDKISLNLSSSSSSSSSSLSSSGSSGSSMPPKSPKHKSPRFHKQIPPVPERTHKPNSLSSSANLSSMNMPPTPPPIPDPPKVQEKPVQHLAPVGDEIDSRFLCVVHCKGKEPSMSRYYLGREKVLTEHIQILCRRFHIEENPARFSLRVVAKKHYLTSEDFDFPACYDMPEDKMLSLTLRPEVCVGDALYALQTVSDDNVSQLKMTLYQLRATLAEGDSELGDELIRQGAVEILLKEYQRSKVASIVSLLLGLFNEIMERPSFPWETITTEFIQETVNRSLVVNVQRPALQTLKWIALSPHFGPGIVVQCFKNINSATPLQAIVGMVNSANVDLKVLGLTLLNSFLHFATQQLLHPETSQAGHELLQNILDEIDRDNINERLKTQIDLVPHIVYNRQLHLYQNYRMWNSYVDFRQKFDENNEEHQQLLGKLWLLSFSDPGDTDFSKVPKGPHRTWLSIGFRSDDPIRHLQSNVLLLKNLVYFTETNQDRVRKATGKQASSLFFPIAAASFSITNILCEMLGFSQDLYDSQCKADVYKLLLDDGVKETDRMGELNACVLRMMEHMWGMLKSPSWDDLPGLSQMMTVLVRETLTSFQPETLANFTSLLQKKAKQVMEGTAEDKKKHSGSFFGRIKKPSAPVKKKKIKFKVFGVSLDEIMRNEKLNDPFAEIPTIFTLLRDAIIRHNGAVLEGIFRISVNMDELGRLKERLNNGDYDLQFENAHYPASLLKAWLRELASPLIPCAFYDECINIAGDKEATSSIILKLPEHNYKIVQEIAKLLQLLGRPEHVAKTKMGFPNLALVFAPAFLQPPPGSSASAFLVNSERERMFVESVIEVVK